MVLSALASLTALGLSSVPATSPDQADVIVLAQSQPYVSSQGAMAPKSNAYMTTPEGCMYMRTQAPGYPERWILVVNPQRLGQATPAKKCRGMR